MNYKIIIFILLFAGEINAQSKSIIIPPNPKITSNMAGVDHGYIQILYALNAINIHDSETYDDLQRLEIGANISKYYSFFIFNNDSLLTDWGVKNPNAASFPSRWLGAKGKNSNNWSEYHFSEYFKDFSNKKLTEYARMPYGAFSNYYSYEDIPIQKWQIHNDTLTIAGHLCQKASCNFRGRDYTAWFTMDIPISNGPWKFGGLPGLILKVYDKDNLYVFECVGIENYKEKYSIKKYDYNKYNKIERGKLLKLQKKVHEDYFKTAGIVFENIEVMGIEKQSYKPLELE